MPAPHLPTLTERWNRVLRERGGHTAVTDCARGKTDTFAAIESQALAIEQELRPLLLRAQTQAPPVVALSLPNGARWLAAYLAIHRCQGVIAPLDPGTAGEVPQALRNAVAKIDANGTAPLVSPALRHHGDSAACAIRPQPPLPSATHLIKLTSGSTGQPQALRFTEANMVADGCNIIATMGLGADSLNYAAIPFGHSYGLGNLVVPFFLQGTAIACASGILPHIIATEIAATKARFFPAVPTLIRALCVAQASARQLASLERVISAGSPLAAEVAGQFYAHYGKRVHNFYGSSETGGICFDASGEATLGGHGVGTALANVQVDTDTQGRVRVQSDAISPDLMDAQQRVVLEDRATLLAGGQLRLEGRGGRMLKIGARRIDLGAWEAQARSEPGIEDAFACEGTRPGGERMLCAAIQTRLPADAVRNNLCQIFPRWQQPARLLALAAFPQTVRGKTDTAALRALLLQEAQT